MAALPNRARRDTGSGIPRSCLSGGRRLLGGKSRLQGPCQAEVPMATAPLIDELCWQAPSPPARHAIDVVLFREEASASAELRLDPDQGDKQPCGRAGEHVMAILRDVQAPLRSYRLSDFPGLFLVLAHLPSSPKEILTFADSYGLLGFPPRQGGWIAPGQVGELVSVWYDRIRWLRMTTDIWNARRSRDTPAIQKIIQERTGRTISETDDLRVMAGRVLYEEIKQEAEVLGHVRVSWDEDRKLPRIAVITPTLWNALLFQLVQAIDQEQAFRACTACGLWFPAGQGRGRSDKTTCSDACRARIYRQRQKAA